MAGSTDTGRLAAALVVLQHAVTAFACELLHLSSLSYRPVGENCCVSHP